MKMRPPFQNASLGLHHRSDVLGKSLGRRDILTPNRSTFVTRANLRCTHHDERAKPQTLRIPIYHLRTRCRARARTLLHFSFVSVSRVRFSLNRLFTAPICLRHHDRFVSAHTSSWTLLSFHFAPHITGDVRILLFVCRLILLVCRDKYPSDARM